MPKFICKCGNIINLSGIPNPHELLVITDTSYDKFSGNINTEELYKQMTIVLNCNNCNRLHFFWKGIDNEPVTYFKE